MTRRGLLLALGAVAVSPLAVKAATKIALRGKLFATQEDAENGSFFLDPENESESLTIMANAGGAVATYLQGSVGRVVTVTIEPQAP